MVQRSFLWPNTITMCSPLYTVSALTQKHDYYNSTETGDHTFTSETTRHSPTDKDSVCALVSSSLLKKHCGGADCEESTQTGLRQGKLHVHTHAQSKYK